MGQPGTRDLVWDPYDVEIDADPYAVYARLRDEAPLYYNEQYDFFAVSRFDDVERGLLDARAYQSGRGAILELIRSGIEMPPGTLIFEDPPAHTVHRNLLSRVFTPKRVVELEPKIRELCAQSLDPLVGSGGFDLIAEYGAQMPARVIGALIGIPEADQQHIRSRVDANLRTEAGKPMEVADDVSFGSEMYAEYIDWRIEHPADDLMTELLHTEFEDEHGTVRTLTRDEALLYTTVVAGAGNETTTRLIGWAGTILADHPDQRRAVVEDRSLLPAAIEELLRYEPPGPHVGRHVPDRGRGARADRPRRLGDDLPARRGQPRRPPLGRPRAVRRTAPAPDSPHVRARRALLPRRRAGPSRGPHRPRRAPDTLPRVGGRHRRRPARTDLHRARLGDAPDRRAVTRTAPPARRALRQSSPAGARRGDARRHRRGRRRVGAGVVDPRLASRDDPRRRRTARR